MKYNILTEPWISVLYTDGTYGEIGLIEAIESSHKIRHITYGNPMHDVSVFLVMLGMLMDALKESESLDDDDEEDEDDEPQELAEFIPTRKFYVQKQFLKNDIAQIKDAFSQWINDGFSFDLFDPDHPFLQVWGDPTAAEDENIVSVACMDYELPSGNNALFQKRQTEYAFSPAEFLVQLCVSIRFSLQGGSGWYSNVFAPNPTFCMPTGNTLYETLIMNMIPYPGYWRDMSRSENIYGTPWWRKMNLVKKGAAFPETDIHLLERMFYPVRVYQAILDPDGKIRNVHKCHGNSVKYANGNAIIGTTKDPYVLYVSKKDKIKPVMVEEAKPFYSNIQTLLAVTHAAETEHYALAVQTAANLVRTDKPFMKVSVYAGVANKAVYCFTQKYSYSFPPEFFCSDDPEINNIRTRLIEAIKVSEKCEEVTIAHIKTALQDILNQNPSSIQNKFKLKSHAAEIERQFEDNFNILCYNALVHTENMPTDLSNWNQTVRRICITVFQSAISTHGLRAISRLKLAKIEANLKQQLDIKQGIKKSTNNNQPIEKDFFDD